ncbi:hypothetical protein F5Y14DRAFT_447664 [Nemania sp. NC0429]|nr:hypothetical protein F5Y14DRAFT_447664 [Nemania sp. NC0429]
MSTAPGYKAGGDEELGPGVEAGSRFSLLVFLLRELSASLEAMGGVEESVGERAYGVWREKRYPGKVRFGNNGEWVDHQTAVNKVGEYVDFTNNVQQIYCTGLEPGDYNITIDFHDNLWWEALTVPYGLAWLVF